MKDELQDSITTNVKVVENGFEVWVNNEFKKRFKSLYEATEFIFIRTDYHKIEMQREIEIFNQNQLKWQKEWSTSLGILMKKKK